LTGRRGLAAGGAALAIVAAAPAIVPAAPSSSPKHGASFKGTGRLYTNNAPTWRRSKTEQLSFTISADGRRILGFHGYYSSYCNVPMSTVSAAYLNVTSAGTFSYRFSALRRDPAGHVNGRTYASISGRFTSARTATLSYLVNYGGLHDRTPYDTSKPHALGCAAWVRGTAHAR
jgi:hypothetical protein